MRATVVTGICLAGFALGCSWITDFAVSNRSESPIRITYSYSGTSSECPFERWERPAITSTAPMGWWRPRAEWTELSHDAYHLDPEGCSVSTSLQPGTAVRVAEGLNYTGHRSGRWGILADLRLTIASPSGEITLQGLELVRSFSKRSDVLYEYRYESPSFSEVERGAAQHV